MVMLGQFRLPSASQRNLANRVVGIHQCGVLHSSAFHAELPDAELVEQKKDENVCKRSKEQ